MAVDVVNPLMCRRFAGVLLATVGYQLPNTQFAGLIALHSDVAAGRVALRAAKRVGPSAEISRKSRHSTGDLPCSQ